MLNIKEDKNGISIKIAVTAGSSQNSIIGITEGILKIKVNSPPIEGRANKEIIEFLSKLINVPKSSIKILKGQKSKIKTLVIQGNSTLITSKLKNIQI